MLTNIPNTTALSTWFVFLHFEEGFLQKFSGSAQNDGMKGQALAGGGQRGSTN